MGAAKWERCGASVIGPGHIADGLPNQDAWMRFGGAYGCGIVVCDGLGSMKHSAAGARAACLAVAQAAGIWSREGARTDQSLLRLIHILWHMKVGEIETSDYACTCLFALALNNGEVLAAQLGDGLIAVEVRPEGLSQLSPEREGFCNETTGLGVAAHIREWTTQRYQTTGAAFVLLATDGVSDDLMPGALPDFVAELKALLFPASPLRRGARLRSELVHWKRPCHSDDKTIAIMWRGYETAKGE